MQAWEIGIALIAGIAAVAEDLRDRHISNWIPVFILAGGFAVHVVESGLFGAATAAGGALCGFAVFLVFYLLGGLGGGDVKLMAGYGGLLGPERVWVASWWTAVLGALLALGVLVWSRIEGRQRRSIPYAPAVVLGVWIALGAGR
jgi:prepilin peptidase CpaA